MAFEREADAMIADKKGEAVIAMKTDAEIEAERQQMEPLIGPTRSGWYAEACDIYPSKDGHPATLWACRYREMASECCRLEQDKAALVTELRAALVIVGDLQPTDGGPQPFLADMERWQVLLARFEK